MTKIIDVSSRSKKDGKRSIKILLHEIHVEKNDTNKNGLHWDLNYVKEALDSIVGMPICAEFMSDEKDMPCGHGLIGVVENEYGQLESVFNGEVVGSIQKAYIQEVNVNGKNIKGLIGEGYIYNQRYPNFTKWLKKEYSDSVVDTSIEIMGLSENDNKIIYDTTCECSEKYRVPMKYSYSGVAILSVPPADENAIVLEVAQNKNVEGIRMDKELQEAFDKVLNAIKDNSVKEDLSNIKELNEDINAKDIEINKLKEDIETKTFELEGLKKKEVELNNTISEKDKTISELNEKIVKYEEQIEESEKETKIKELNEAIAKYSDEDVKYAETEINQYKENPLEGNLDMILGKICRGLVEKKFTEINSSNLDIFSDVDNEKDSDELDIFN